MPRRSPNVVAAHTHLADQPAPGVTVGVLSAPWRATVTPWGSIRQWDGLPALDWHVAADDRWHTPASEPTIRQQRLDGTAVVETRLRVPQGDVVQRVFAIADRGGLTVIEVENDSPLPIAVAFTGCPVESVRPPARVPVEGIDLPADTVVFPIGHRTSITVALPHTGGVTGLPAQLPSAQQVARGWMSTCDRASRLELPDTDIAQRVVAARCELLLAGPPRPADDPVEFVLAVHQLVRMIGGADDWMRDVADAVATIARPSEQHHVAEIVLALDAAVGVSEAAADHRARRDLVKLRDLLLGKQVVVPLAPVSVHDDLGARFVAGVERRLATGGDLLPTGLPASWLGQNFEVHDVPTVGAATISFAVRWHGDRPAVLWQCAGAPVHLTSSSLAPGWSSDQATGEALWPVPATAAERVTLPSDEPMSFS